MIPPRRRSRRSSWLKLCILGGACWRFQPWTSISVGAPEGAGNASVAALQGSNDGNLTSADRNATAQRDEEEQLQNDNTGERTRTLQEDMLHMAERINVNRQVLDDVVVGAVVGGVTGAAAGAGGGTAVANALDFGLKGAIRAGVAAAAMGAVGGALAGAAVGCVKPDIAAAGVTGAGVGAAVGAWGSMAN
eukprot:CAMPEP_0204011088 /NCGR_PEP_ID=MMETSP0360-20130528/23014_1 /ASSEMBLY_ACC=CAM_ASM_000342 /TAXON_ID=268821 /ORGANISM="Scrippsiella Hangoei, Strain SHTV-5" /LENGTH=190 /DNA_ID=CAMNT_0050953615 /DNA_START=49 /DNA_END=618 /DNA_ORIENTATION=-